MTPLDTSVSLSASLSFLPHIPLTTMPFAALRRLRETLVRFAQHMDFALNDNFGCLEAGLEACDDGTSCPVRKGGFLRIHLRMILEDIGSADSEVAMAAVGELQQLLARFKDTDTQDPDLGCYMLVHLDRTFMSTTNPAVSRVLLLLMRPILRDWRVRSLLTSSHDEHITEATALVFDSNILGSDADPQVFEAAMRDPTWRRVMAEKVTPVAELWMESTWVEKGMSALVLDVAVSTRGEQLQHVRLRRTQVLAASQEVIRYATAAMSDDACAGGGVLAARVKSESLVVSGRW